MKIKWELVNGNSQIIVTFATTFMKIEELLQLYARSPQVGALAEVLRKKSVQTVFLDGLVASSTAMTFASLSVPEIPGAPLPPLLFILIFLR